MPATFLHIAPDHSAFAGHFPGAPILPGAALLAEVTEALRTDVAARAALGESPRLGAVKFTAPCAPDARLRIEWEVQARRVAFSAVRLDAASETGGETGGDPGRETVAAIGHFEIGAG